MSTSTIVRPPAAPGGVRQCCGAVAGASTDSGPDASPDARTGGVGALLALARAGLERLTPAEVQRAVADGALLIDTRTLEQRSETGDLPGAICIDRTVLEWRLAPDSAHRIPEASDPGRTIVVVCRQGYSSSLAAASLQAVGLTGATDMIGGFEAWVAAGLPLSDAPADVRR